MPGLLSAYGSRLRRPTTAIDLCPKVPIPMDQGHWDKDPRCRFDAMPLGGLYGPPKISPSLRLPPCLPTPAQKPPSGSAWVHEIKHDGYRLIARKDGNRVRLYTRR